MTQGSYDVVVLTFLQKNSIQDIQKEIIQANPDKRSGQKHSFEL